MRTRTLYEWFAHSAARHPHRPAVELADGTAVTYRELERTACSLARDILDMCDGTPLRVALLAERSLAAFAGYLAVQRLGAAVIPLNPQSPPARNAAICALAGADLLLTEPGADPAAHAPAVRSMTLDAAGTPVGDSGGRGSSGGSGSTDEPAPARAGDPDSLAYILFTSGSTGRPKGVPVRHRNISPHLAFHIERYAIGPECRMSHTFGMAFDASVQDLFTAWGAGACLVVPGRRDLHDPVAYIAGRGLTHWHSVPSVIAVAEELGRLPRGRVTGLRHSIFGGERVTARHCALWREVAPQTRIHNAYGPTETTITCSAYELPADPADWPATPNGSLPIGEVYPHMQAVLLDAGGLPADEGELCLRGPQRFTGYLEPGDDEGRFVALPGNGRPAVPAGPQEPVTADHWYRTGDRVRRESGLLVHLGRLDEQVKISGHRVELGEIEAALLDQPEVTRAVVIAVEKAGAQELLAAYTGRPLPPGDLPRRLRRTLPRQVVPRHVHHLPDLPLNANGKIDRTAVARRLASADAPGGRADDPGRER